MAVSVSYVVLRCPSGGCTRLPSSLVCTPTAARRDDMGAWALTAAATAHSTATLHVTERELRKGVRRGKTVEHECHHLLHFWLTLYIASDDKKVVETWEDTHTLGISSGLSESRLNLGSLVELRLTPCRIDTKQIGPCLNSPVGLH